MLISGISNIWCKNLLSGVQLLKRHLNDYYLNDKYYDFKESFELQRKVKKNISPIKYYVQTTKCCLRNKMSLKNEFLN